MNLQFSALEPEYVVWLARAKILHPTVVRARVEEILAKPGILDQYLEIQKATGVPAAWIFATNEREGSSNLHTYFGNGDSLYHVTHDVPRGRGPFKTFAEGAIDALHLDHINQVKDWTWPRAIFEWELWNGFGPREHGRVSGYPWAGTNIYNGGKYIRDGVWSSSAWDTQLGCYEIAVELLAIHPELAFDDHPAKVDDVPPAFTKPAPVEFSAGTTQWVQQALNKLNNAELAIDGSFGRDTRRAVEYFQKHNGLTVDGLVGDKTKAAISAALAKGE